MFLRSHLWVGILLFSASSLFADKGPVKTSDVSFHKNIRPILQAKCQGCHQPAKKGGEYDMTHFDLLLKGGESESKAIIPGKPSESYLIELIQHNEKGEAEMPRDKDPLSASEIALIKKWIEQGAKNDTPESVNIHFNNEHPPEYTAAPVITSIDYSPDGKLLAVAGFHEVLLHNADGSGLAGRLIGLSERIESVRFSPDGTKLVVAGGLPARMGEIQVWDMKTKKLVMSLPVSHDTVYGANWSPDGKYISYGCADNTVRAIDSTTGKEVLYQGAHNDWVLDTVFSVKGTHIVSVSRDHTVKLTEFKTQRFIDNITSITPGALKGGMAAIEFLPKENAFVVGGADGTPKIYRMIRTTKRVIGDDANLIRQFPALAGRIFDVAISTDGRHIASVSSYNGKGSLSICQFEFSLETNKDIAKLSTKAPKNRTPEDKKKLNAYYGKGVKELGKLDFDSGLFAVAFHPNGKQVAAAGFDGKIRLVDATNGKLIKEFLPVTLKPTDSNQDKKTLPVSQSIIENTEPSEEPERLSSKDEIVSLEVSPKMIDISHRYDSAQIIVTGIMKNGSRADLTRMVKTKLSAPNVTISKHGLVRALKDGETEISFSLAGQSVKTKVSTSHINGDFHPSFVRDVNPVISKMGCNSGTCHGANKGKAGFKLSLRGNDSIFDLRAFTDDHACRRINVASPENSLMLLKGTSAVPHQGGQVTRPGEPHYEIVKQWIADGAPLDHSIPKVTQIEVFPKNPIVQHVNSNQQFRVIATYADGKKRDVTSDSHFESGNIEIVTTYKTGLVKVLRRGEASVLIRYEGAYAATTLTVMGDRTGFTWKDVPVQNHIDKLIDQKLKRTKTNLSPLCTDAEFFRRIHLDLTGIPPEPQMVKAFLADKRKSKIKRDEVINQLVGSEEYIEHWTNKWADMLQVNRKYLGTEGSSKFRNWIRTSVSDNLPYDRFVYSILTAKGSNRDNPQASYYKIHRTPEETMETTTHLFLAIRFNCNKCHDHPFEKWTQDQYYETAAFFTQFQLTKDPASGNKNIGGTAVEGKKPLYEMVTDTKKGDMTHIRTGKIVPPKLPYHADHSSGKEIARREEIAKWITSADNTYFAKSYVNRLWGYLLGTGLIEPLDDIRAGNPPTNPELLDWLTTEFINSGFNVRHLIRTICRSRTYQLSIQSNNWNEDDDINYSHAKARRLPAEVLYDSLIAVTGSVSKIPGVAAGTRAAELPDSGVKIPGEFLLKFGRPVRESPCECERSAGMQMGPVMALISGPTLNNAISNPDNAIARMVNNQKEDKKLIDDLFMRILNRNATAEEITSSEKLFQSINSEHNHLAGKLAILENKLAPAIAKQKETQKQNIKKAKAELAAHEKKIAPKEAELEKAYQQKISNAKEELKKHESQIPQMLASWEKRSDRQTKWTVLKPSQFKAVEGIKLTLEKDNSLTASGTSRPGTYTITTETDLKNITAIRLEAITDKRLPKSGPGRAGDGNFVLTEFRVKAAPKNKPKEMQNIKLSNAQADFSQNGYPVSTAIDGSNKNDGNGWAISPQGGKNHVATFDLKNAIGFDKGTILTFFLDQKYIRREFNLGRFRISVSTTPFPTLIAKTPDEVEKILTIPEKFRQEKQKEDLLKYFQGIDPELKVLQKIVATVSKPRPVNPKLKELKEQLAKISKPLPVDPKLKRLRRDVQLSTNQLKNSRLTAAQDLTWALMNSPAFLFNR